MTKKQFDGLLEAVRSGGVLDWVCSNHYDLDKDDLAVILGDVGYAMYSAKDGSVSDLIEAVCAELKGHDDTLVDDED